jgi:hypothetical protein
MSRFSLIACAILLSSPVFAGNGPCGIDLGTWGDSRKRCEGMSKHKFGKQNQDGYMVFKRDLRWEQWESYCTIRNPSVKNGVCTYRLLCQGEFADVQNVSFKILDPKRIAFIYAGKETQPYYYCFPKSYSPYED